MKLNKKVLILANGKFPKKRESLALLSNADFLICCDGAASHAIKLGRKPDLIIGDMDSCPKKIIDSNRSIVKHIDDQDSSDLSKALSWLIDKDIEEATVLGADGLRDDHYLANIFLLLSNSYPYTIKMITDHGEFDAINSSLMKIEEQRRSQLFSSFAGQGVSIFCIDKSAKINSNGLQYPLDNFSIDNLFDASLNISIANQFTISCDREGVSILVYREDEQA